jgi:hypothetical protein
MHRGYVKLWRKSLVSSIWTNPKLWRVWTWCLLKASYCETTEMVGFQEVHLEPGQFIFGRITAAKETGLSEQEIRTAIDSMRKRQNLTIKSTNKYSIISIVNWMDYQDELTIRSTSQQPATNQQLTTNNKDNKVKNIKKEEEGILENVPFQEIVDLYHKHCPEMRRVSKISPGRREKIRTRWKDEGESIEVFEKVFKAAGQSPFMNGKSVKPWWADFDWFMKNADNMIKVLEGKYTDKEQLPLPIKSGMKEIPDL